ncbi:MAG: hypothetical protein M1561_04395 [Gammaproteobacteria bacterium]|nr:hypothetical protein [Gammaproteobacteria bacterium]
MKKPLIVFFFSLIFICKSVFASISDHGLRFNSGEHIFIGNAITIFFPILANGSYQYQDVYGGQADFRAWLNLPLKQTLTFGKLVATPDLFADPNTAISDGATLAERCAIFEKCLNVFLASSKETLDQVFANMDDEAAWVEFYLLRHWQPSKMYEKYAKIFVIKYFLAVPASAQLQLIGWDHFGKYATLAYVAGHAEAIKAAVAAHNTKDAAEQRQKLVQAYAKEGYADHFLTDRFASGHMRTPDKEIAQILPKDFGSQAVAALIAVLMHDEDNKYGLTVSNLHGDHWISYGDRRYLDHDDAANYDIIQKATQTSSDEIKKAFLTGLPIQPENFAALQFLTNLDKLNDYLDYVNNQHGIVPIFAYDAATNDVLRRPDINKLHPDPQSMPITKGYFLSHSGTKGWNEWETLLELEFNYHPELFVNVDVNAKNYLAANGRLNAEGMRLLASSLNLFERAVFCADKTTEQKLRNYLQCE